MCVSVCVCSACNTAHVLVLAQCAQTSKRCAALQIAQCLRRVHVVPCFAAQERGSRLDNNNVLNSQRLRLHLYLHLHLHLQPKQHETCPCTCNWSKRSKPKNRSIWTSARQYGRQCTDWRRMTWSTTECYKRRISTGKLRRNAK